MTVSLVGAGPGDPELITVRGLARVRDVRGARLRPARRARDRRARRRSARCASRATALTQDDINALLVAHGRRGRRVVRLKGGDPFVFGRGGEEALALVRAGVPFELVPGVSSIAAVPESVGIPVTHRGVSQAVTAFAANDVEAARRARRSRGVPGTLVAFMGGAVVGAARRAADRRGQARVDAGRGRLARDDRGRAGDRRAARLDRRRSCRRADAGARRDRRGGCRPRSARRSATIRRVTDVSQGRRPARRTRSPRSSG